jgi:acyl-CoA reductase-like NAD-dependent aldehyde dehydrogenase
MAGVFRPPRGAPSTPSTPQVIATVAESNEIDVDHAVAAAHRAFEGSWRTMRAAERGHILHKWADLLKNHSDEIAELVGRFHGSNLMPIKIGSPGWRCGTTANEKPRMTADTIGFLESVV